MMDTAVVAQLRTFIPPRSAWLVNLAEEELRELPLDDPGLLRVALGGRQVVTVKLRF
jgi:hypothetical protein